MLLDRPAQPIDDLESLFHLSGTEADDNPVDPLRLTAHQLFNPFRSAPGEPVEFRAPMVRIVNELRVTRS
jgi:hypothetical protein